LLALLAATSGCSRQHYRLQADREVDALIEEKSNDLRWAVADFSIELDPRSRYFDEYDPDKPPMPPDDPASHQFMHCVDCKKGWPHWHRNGDRYELENSNWHAHLAEYAPLNERGEVVLDVDTALKLSYMHSPDYQQQLETLYLSALDVSTERFRLDTQFFGGADVIYAHNGDLTRPGLGYNTVTRRFEVQPARETPEQNRLTVGRSIADPSFRIQRKFATAGELLVGFANSFVWEFTGGDANLTSSIGSFSLVQPLLRGAGRNMALEQLTIVERTLLGNLRAYERYRHGFYTRVAIGDLGVSGPSRRGGFLGGTGLTGFSGTGAGGLGGVGAATGFGRTSFGTGGSGGGGSGSGFAGGGEGAVGGYLGLLQQLQQNRNTQDSLNLKLRTLALLEAYLDAGVINLVQVDQFRQSIETERANLIRDQNSLLAAQDSFVVGTLGLPPDLPVTLDDQMIQQFQLVDPRATALQTRIADLQAELGNLTDDPSLDALQELLRHIAPLLQQFEAGFGEVRQDLARMQAVAGQREQAMSDQERTSFQNERKQLADALADVQQRFQAAVPKLNQLRTGLSPSNRRETAAGLVVWLGEQYRLAGEVMLVQARARLEAVVIEPVEIDAETAFQTALANRLDLMNARASLVDSWRLIAFNANALQSRVDVVLDGNLSTARNNPLSFNARTGTVRAGLEFDAPFTRLLERNNYRQALIDYQQDRRGFIQALDSVHGTMRTMVRELKRLQVNLEIQRRAAAISIRRVDMTQEDLNKPVPPPEPGQTAAQFGPTAAQDLLNALSDLSNTQNNFMSVWLNYYSLRMRLMRDLGLMQLDAQGRWIDTPLSELERPAPEEIATPPAVPAEWMDEIFWDEAGESAVLEDPPVEARASSPEGSDLQIQDNDRPEEPPPASLHVVCTYVPNKSDQPSKSQDIAVKDGGLPAPNRRVTPDDGMRDRPTAATVKVGITPAGVRFLGERQNETHP
jgi:hypothetical protein